MVVHKVAELTTKRALEAEGAKRGVSLGWGAGRHRTCAPEVKKNFNEAWYWVDGGAKGVEEGGKGRKKRPTLLKETEKHQLSTGDCPISNEQSCGTLRREENT